MKDLIIIGAGTGEIIKLIEDINSIHPEWNVIGFTDVRKELHGKELLGYPILGDDDVLEKYPTAWLAVNIGMSPEIRERIFEKFKDRKFATLIHPSVNTNKVEISGGALIYEGTILGERVKIGRGVFINYSVTICHESMIGDFSVIAPGAVINGRVKIGRKVFIGARAVLRNEITIGDQAVIGMGAVVLKNVEKQWCVVGNPARFYDYSYNVRIK